MIDGAQAPGGPLARFRPRPGRFTRVADPGSLTSLQERDRVDFAQHQAAGGSQHSLFSQSGYPPRTGLGRARRGEEEEKPSASRAQVRGPLRCPRFRHF